MHLLADKAAVRPYYLGSVGMCVGKRSAGLAATRIEFVQWPRVAAGWTNGGGYYLQEGYRLNEQVKWSLRNGTKRNEEDGLEAERNCIRDYQCNLYFFVFVNYAKLHLQRKSFCDSKRL